MTKTLLLISGSTRAASMNTAALRTLQAMSPGDMTSVLYDGLARLPAFNPDDDDEPLPPEVAKLRSTIAASDVVLFCTPEYAGSLPGSLKNLLDWTVGGPQMYAKPVAWINIAHPGRGDSVIQALRVVLGYIGAKIIEDACANIPVGRDMLDGFGRVLAVVGAYLDELHRPSPTFPD